MKEEFSERRIEQQTGERGAALVMVLMVSFLLLVASAGLLLETSLNTANVTDITAEQQAYNAAESGIQSTINVFRGNVAPNPLLDATKPATNPANKVDFVKVLRLSSSNVPGDTSTVARLSRWIPYNYAPANVAVSEQRIAYWTPTGTTYDPSTGFAFQLSVSDPDQTGTFNSFNTTGSIDNQGPVKTYTSGGNWVRITYNPVSVSNLDVSSGNAATNLGSFRIECSPGGGTVSTRARFQILMTMTRPYNAVKAFRGWIETGTVTNGWVSTVKLTFDTQISSIMGSTVTLSGVNSAPPFVITPNAPDVNGGVTVLNATMSQAQPSRLAIRSVGFGPRGARKVLEAIVERNFFDGIPAPSTLTLVGPSNGSVFNLGNSAALTYSGDDVASTMYLPPIGTTNDALLATVTAAVNASNGTIIGTPSNIAPEVPPWLSTPVKLDAAIQNLRNVASSSGRYFPSGQQPATFGDNVNATGITFMDGNGVLTGAGGGILVCTGRLILSGGFNFNGLIIVTGSGGVARSGGGNGMLQGAMVVAPYNPSALTDNDPTNDVFLGPRYDLAGGGSSSIVYNSSSIANGMTAVSNVVQGVAEK